MNKLLDKSVFKIAILVLLFFGISCYLNFANDSYIYVSTSFSESAKDMFSRNARPIIALLYWLYGLTNLKVEGFYYLSAILGLVTLIISIKIYADLLNKYISNVNVCILLSFLSIANIFIIEYFMYIERLGFMLGVLFCVLASLYTEQFIRVGGGTPI